MAYISNIPQPTDLFSQSQPQILGNFGAIKTLIDVNHVDFADATNQGKHNFVSFYPQTVAPTLNNTTDVIAYGLVSPITSQNELYISKVNQVTVTLIPSTASILSVLSAPATNSQGWSYLPSGILIKWGQTDITSTALNPVQTFTYPVAANIPVFNQVFSVQLSTYSSSAVDGDKIVTLNAPGLAFSTTTFSAVATQRTVPGVYVASRLQYLAIGY